MTVQFVCVCVSLMTRHFCQDFAHHEVRSSDRWDAGDYATRQRNKETETWVQFMKCKGKQGSNSNNNRTTMFWLNYVTRKCGLLLVGKCSLCLGNLAGWILIIHPFLLKDFWWFNSQVKRTLLQLRIMSVVLRKKKILWPWFDIGMHFMLLPSRELT